jgi:phosphoribosylcarboxyaminoimidazole (NCAIR) mutase
MAGPQCETYPEPGAARLRLAAAELGPEAAAALAADESLLHEGSLVPASRRLLEQGLAEDAVKVLGQALTRRAAAWWVCRIARDEPDGPAFKELPALEAAESWVRTPEQWRAYAAQRSSEEAGLTSPSGCAALAAFLAGEAISPPNVPVVAPPAHLPGMVAAAAAVLASQRRRPAEAEARLASILAMGFAIAAGADSWNDAPLAGRIGGS